MRNARGTYLQFLDSDDWLEPDALEKAVAAAEETGAGVVIFDAVYEWPDRSWHEKSSLAPGVCDGETVLRYLARPSIPPYAWNKFSRRSLYEGVTFPEGEKWEDVPTTFHPVSRAGKVAVLGEALYHYRQRPEAITKRAAADGSIYYWRYRQYRRRYEALEMEHPAAAREAKRSVVRNAVLCAAVWYRGGAHRRERREIRRYLAGAAFRRDLGWKTAAARLGYLLAPELTAALVRLRLGKTGK